ncbi:MAG: hypothetical protein IH831_09820 [Planctomycetes bacterium]|nr:hypothetical protein [Planctomycetota bacterium]
MMFKIVGFVAVSFGAFTAIFGSFWASRTMQIFSDNPLGPLLDYFVPFLPIFLMLFGAYLLTSSRRRT